VKPFVQVWGEDYRKLHCQRKDMFVRVGLCIQAVKLCMSFQNAGETRRENSELFQQKSCCRFKCEAYIHVSKFSTNIFDLVLQNRIDF